MDSVKKVYLAMDTSYQQGVVVLFFEDELLFSVLLTDKMAHGKELCHAFNDALEFCRQHQLMLDGIFCGLGPGSFVGVRVALATALGFSFASQIPLMGFCSHQALAYSCALVNENFSLFMKASGDLGYFTPLFVADGVIHQQSATEVISVSDLAVKIGGNGIFYSDQADSLLNHGLGAKFIAGPSAEGVKRAALGRLSAQGFITDESITIKPNYIKLPNVSVPKKNIVIGHLVN